jgi:hypothetical protein
LKEEKHMHVPKSILLLMTGAMSGVAFVLSCGDNLSAKANADAAIDAPQVPDAVPTCDCPAAEPPLAGRFMVVGNTRPIPANDTGAQSAVCPVGAQLISGSCTTDNPSTLFNVALRESGFKDSTPREWLCSFRNNEPVPVTIRVSVICLEPTP